MLSSAELAATYDVIVIGGGPVGCAAAQQAAFLGRNALLIDDPKGLDEHTLDVSFGGPTGLFSKALRDVAKSIDLDALCKHEGMSDADIWAHVGENITRLASNNASKQVDLLSQMRVVHLRARAQVVPSGDAVVACLPGGSEVTIKTRHILIATGSSP